MSQPGKALLILAGVSAVLLLMKAANFANNVQLYFQKIRFGGSFLYPEAYATFALLNPTDVAITVDQVVGKITVNGQDVAEVNAPEAVHIQPKQTIEFELKLQSTLQQLLKLFNPGAVQATGNNIFFVGDIITNGIAIPVKNSLT